ncbi:extracellular solute-binding protein [Streptomyces sp. Da 82-17]|uniref:extracellular solute-binding protein n=1 Tax=Streptomyces sp. Da 82-17 TaxID=3377116 RepID=UPI0038D46E79
MEIDVWLADHPFPNFLDPVRKCAEEFGRRHPEYRVVIQGYDYWTQRQKFFDAVEQGRAPAIVDFFYTATQIARDLTAKDGGPLFTSIEKAIGGRTEILGEPVIVDDLVVAARDYYSYGGELVSLPNSTSTSLLYANTTLLEAAGVFEVPRTWAEVEAACEAVAKLDGGPSHGITWPNHGWFFQQALAEQGTPLTDHDNGRSGRARRVNLTSEALLSWVRWWQRLSRDGHYLYTGEPNDWAGTLDAFVNQRVAFTLNSSVIAEQIVRAGDEGGFRVTAARMPYNETVAYGGDVIGGDSLWLADGLDPVKRDGALAFLQFLLNPRNAAAWHRSSGFIPVTRSAFELLESEGWFADRPHHRLANEQLDAGDRSPAAQGALLGDFTAIEETMTRAMADVLVDGAEPEARFAEAEKEAQLLLDAYNAKAQQRG